MSIFSSIPSPFSVEGAYFWFQGLAAIFIAGTVLTSIGTIVTGYISHRRQLDRTLILERGVADAKKGQAEAEASLERLRRKGAPRAIVFDEKAFVKALEGKPTASVELLYRPSDEEAQIFATVIRRWLGKDPGAAGWEVSEPKPIPDGKFSYLPLWLFGLRANVALFANKEWVPLEKENALGALINALEEAGIGGVLSKQDSLLADNSLVLVIGAKSQ